MTRGVPGARRSAITCLGLVLLFGSASSSWAASFVGLSEIPGWPLTRLARVVVSADGSTVAADGSGAVRWSGARGLEILPGRYSTVFVLGISGDGAWVVGGTTSQFSTQGLLWGPDGSSTDVPRFEGISDDGLTLVGSSLGDGVRWTADEGLVALGVPPYPFPGIQFPSIARAASADASVIVGSATSADGFEAFRWTEESGAAFLGYLEGGGYADALGVSADGRVVVGKSESHRGVEAFRWTVEGGMMGLGDLEGGGFANRATDASGDGSVILGLAGFRTVIWDATHGLRDLKTALETDHGLELEGWQLGFASAISNDGLVIVGTGGNPDGNGDIWIATLPEPSSWVLGLVGLVLVLGIAGWRKRQLAAP